MISCLLPVQNLYIKCMRTIQTNANYLCMFLNYRDKSIINSVSRQIEPTNTSFIKEAYAKACDKPYQFLFFDFTVNAPNSKLRIRNTILLEEKTEIYLPK